MTNIQESCRTSVAKAIKEKSLVQYIKNATIQEEVQKSNCIYDLIMYDNVNENDLKAEVIKCLVLLNENLNEKMKLTDSMIKTIVDMVLNDFNGLSIVGFFKCIRKGLRGDYGQVYQMNVMTVTGWVQQYLSADEYMERVYELRRKHDQNKNDELRSMLKGDMIDVMKAALKLTEPKPKEYRPKQYHLDQFKEVIKLFNDEEIEKSIEDWSKRQRPQYVEILNKEKESRN